MELLVVLVEHDCCIMQVLHMFELNYRIAFAIHITAIVNGAVTWYYFSR